MNNKFKPAIRLSIFVAIFILIFVSLNFLFIPKGNSKGFGVDKYTSHGIHAEEDESLDVIFVGDSESYTSFSPLYIFESYGYTSYVCGTSGQKLFTSIEFVKKVIDSQTPELIILETNTIFRKLKPGEADYALLERYIPLLRYHNTWKDIRVNLGKPKLNKDYLKGHKPRFGKLAPNLDGYMAPTAEEETIPKDNLAILNKIVALCKESNVKPLFVSTPSPENWNMKRHNTILKYSNENNIDYIDFNTTDININWNEDTYDGGDHLNIYGSRKVCKYIAEYIKSSGLNIKDQRENESYSHWFEDLNKYKEIIEKKQSIY